MKIAPSEHPSTMGSSTAHVAQCSLETC